MDLEITDHAEIQLNKALQLHFNTSLSNSLDKTSSSAKRTVQSWKLHNRNSSAGENMTLQ